MADHLDTPAPSRDPHRGRRSLLLACAVLTGLAATGAGAFALMSASVNTHDPSFQCAGVEDDACLEQTVFARPFHFDTGLWAVALAAAICAMAFTIALLAKRRPSPSA
ncbi:MAG: hypothetical protein ACT4QG_19820 [Sporichthyaceae bacterium]